MRKAIIELAGKVSGSIKFFAAYSGANYSLFLPGNLPAQASAPVIQPGGSVNFEPTLNGIRLGLTLVNNWVNYNTADWGTASCIKRNGIVYLTGVIKGGSYGLNAAIATLPMGYRPHVNMVMAARCDGNGFIRLDIQTNGSIISANEYTGYPGNWISLSGICFPTF